MTRILGILNLTRDSFSDGGRYLDPETALRHARRLCDEGAWAIDLGAESTHPDAEEVSAAQEIDRLEPIVTALKRDGVRVSIDTYKPPVMRAALAWGAATLWFAAAPDLSAALPRAALCGLASSAFMSLNNSLIQLSVTTELRGRVMSAVMLMWGLMPLGVVPVSFLAERVGIAGALSASGAVLLLCIGLAALLLPALRRIDQGYRDRDLSDQTQRVDDARPSAGSAEAVRPPGGGQGER